MSASPHFWIFVATTAALLAALVVFAFRGYFKRMARIMIGKVSFDHSELTDRESFDQSFPTGGFYDSDEFLAAPAPGEPDLLIELLERLIESLKTLPPIADILGIGSFISHLSIDTLIVRAASSAVVLEWLLATYPAHTGKIGEKLEFLKRSENMDAVRTGAAKSSSPVSSQLSGEHSRPG